MLLFDLSKEISDGTVQTVRSSWKKQVVIKELGIYFGFIWIVITSPWRAYRFQISFLLVSDCLWMAASQCLSALAGWMMMWSLTTTQLALSFWTTRPSLLLTMWNLQTCYKVGSCVRRVKINIWNHSHVHVSLIRLFNWLMTVIEISSLDLSLASTNMCSLKDIVICLTWRKLSTWVSPWTWRFTR